MPVTLRAPLVVCALLVASMRLTFGIAAQQSPAVSERVPQIHAKAARRLVVRHANEVHRFGRAGELYAQADPEKLHKVIDAMVAKRVAWDPTFSIYEASRDLVRAQNQPWFKDHLHPSMEEYTDVMTINGRPMPNDTPLGPGDRVQNAHGGGIEWTIKDGIPYHVPTLMREVKEIVAKARERRPTTTAGQ